MRFLPISAFQGSFEGFGANAASGSCLGRPLRVYALGRGAWELGQAACPAALYGEPLKEPLR